MKIKFGSYLLIILLSNNYYSQNIAFQSGLSTDVYSPSKNNSIYNKGMEFHNDFVGINIAYSPKLDTLKNRRLIFFLDLYRLNFGTSIRTYPETENMDFTKITTAGVLSPNIGFLYGLSLYQNDKIELLGFVGSSFRFNLLSMSATGTFINEGQIGITYKVYNELQKNSPINFSINISGQAKVKINNGTRLIFTPIISLGTFNWYDQYYNYEFFDNNEVIENGQNVMRNNGTRFQLMVGLEFSLF